MKNFSKLFGILAILAVSACSNAQDSGTVLEASEGDTFDISHTYQGTTYPLTLKWDGILQGFIVISENSPNTNWTSNEADDIRFQNMVRSAFRSEICEEGLHPGVLQFGYGYAADLGWVARVKCTPKLQADA